MLLLMKRFHINDEAKIPLILAGEKEGEIENVQMFSKIADTMVEGKDYNVDADDKNVYLTEDGTEKIEEYIKCGNLYDEKNMEYLAGINCALYARGLLKKDVDYIIKDGRIKIVDELTGRVAQKRHWPDGIQAAVEAKEGLNIEKGEDCLRQQQFNIILKI